MSKTKLRSRSSACRCSILSSHFLRPAHDGDHRVRVYPLRPRCVNVNGKPCLLVGSGVDVFEVLLFKAEPLVKVNLEAFELRDINDFGRTVEVRSAFGSSVADTTSNSSGIGLRYTRSCSLAFP